MNTDKQVSESTEVLELTCEDIENVSGGYTPSIGGFAAYLVTGYINGVDFRGSGPLGYYGGAGAGGNRMLTHMVL